MVDVKLFNIKKHSSPVPKIEKIKKKDEGDEKSRFQHLFTGYSQLKLVGKHADG
jgi:hypothetical protein